MGGRAARRRRGQGVEEEYGEEGEHGEEEEYRVRIGRGAWGG